MAGAIIRPYFRAGAAAELKGDSSPVTIADREAEQAMRALLTERFPEHGLLGEEHGGAGSDARWRWVLDPIDGTRAFITGRPVFTTLIALMDGGVPVLGVIDQPVTGERWVGVAGRPTRFRGPFGGAPACRPCATLGEAELSCTSPDIFTAESQPRWQGLARRVRRTSWGGGWLRVRPAGAGPDRRDCGGHVEAVGLGRAGARHPGRGRPHHRLQGWPSGRTARARCWPSATRRCSPPPLPPLA